MSAISLFTSTASSFNTLSSSSAAQQQTQQAETQASEQQDTVKLSQAAQAKLLYKQGQSVSAIASALGTTSSAIDEDLGITLEKAIEKAIASSVQA
jgi:hypothetical protein